MTPKPVHPLIKPALEFGPIAAFLVLYLIFRNETFLIGGTEYTGFVAITAAFVPIFVIATGLLWLLTGQIARIQVVTSVMLVLFGVLSVWFNDPRLFKMKPTVVYLFLAAILGVGLLRGQSWLQLIMDEVVPLKDKGWKILTKRVCILFVLSAAANELVWRTQSETFWVFFETLAMPVVIVIFFLSQIPLFVEYATFKQKKKKT